jgi:hypothetical protein
MEIVISPQIMNKSDLDHHSTWYKLGKKFYKSVVESMVYKRIVIEWELKSVLKLIIYN